MRIFCLFFTLLFFEKNAVAVVRASVENHPQLVENQSVKLLKGFLKTTTTNHAFENSRPEFFKKGRMINALNAAKLSPKNAKLSVIFGLLAFIAAFLAVGTLSSFFFLLWLVFMTSGLAFGAIAISEKEKRKLGWLGAILSAASAIFCVLLYVIAWSGD